jgi:selenocysteine-specific elongation factor
LPRRKDRQGWEHRAALLRAARQGNIERLVTEALVVSAPRPANAADLERRFGLEAGAVAASISHASAASPGTAHAVALGNGSLWTTAGTLQALAEELFEAVARHHRTAPDDPGAPLETLRAALASKAGREAADEVIARGLDAGRLVRSAEGLVRLPSFAAQSDARFDATADQVSGLLARAAADGITEAGLAAESGASVAAVRAALSRLASMNRARRLGGLWFAETELDRVREAVRTFFATRDSMSLSDFKTITGVTRKQAIPLLEQLDREATTKRVGDLRVLGTKGRSVRP